MQSLAGWARKFAASDQARSSVTRIVSKTIWKQQLCDTSAFPAWRDFSTLLLRPNLPLVHQPPHEVQQLISLRGCLGKVLEPTLGFSHDYFIVCPALTRMDGTRRDRGDLRLQELQKLQASAGVRSYSQGCLRSSSTVSQPLQRHAANVSRQWTRSKATMAAQGPGVLHAAQHPTQVQHQSVE